jgi:hypothetical protein
VLKRVLVAANNVHRPIFRHAALGGHEQLWFDYCQRIKEVILGIGGSPPHDHLHWGGNHLIRGPSPLFRDEPAGG